MMSRKREIVTRKLIPFISLLGNLFRPSLYINSSLHLRLFVSLSDRRGSPKSSHRFSYRSSHTLDSVGSFRGSFCFGGGDNCLP